MPNEQFEHICKDRSLYGSNNLNLYVTDAAYEEIRDKKECCFEGCTTKLNSYNDRTRDFCCVHIPIVANILSTLPEDDELEQWKIYYWLEKGRKMLYGLGKRVI